MDTLQKILANNPELETLYLLDTPQIPLQEKLRLIHGTGISDFLDTELLALPFEEPSGDFHRSKEEIYAKIETLPPTLPPVSQILVTVLGKQSSSGENIDTSDGGVQIDKATDPSRLSSFRPDNYTFPFDLNGVVLPSSAFFDKLCNVFSFFINYDMKRQHDPFHNIGKYLALCLAMDPFDRKDDGEYRVRNFPAQLYRDIHAANGDLPQPKRICHGEWSLLLVIGCSGFRHDEAEQRELPVGHEAEAIRYAFLSAEHEVPSLEQTDIQKTKIIKKDMKGFVDRTVEDPSSRKAILRCWKDNFCGKAKVCGMEEVESYLRCDNYAGTPQSSSDEDTVKEPDGDQVEISSPKSNSNVLKRKAKSSNESSSSSDSSSEDEAPETKKAKTKAASPSVSESSSSSESSFELDTPEEEQDDD